jgi:2-iminoacetate synthase
MRILLVAGESAPSKQKIIDYYCKSVEAIYAARYGQYKIKRVNINCAPLSVEEFKILKTTGIGTYQIFQETFHDETYHKVHISGPKADPDNRITAVDRAFQAGIDDVGIGILYGLYDYRFETLAMLSYIEHLEKTFGIGPHTISVPRIEPALGSDLSQNIPHPISDDDFRRLVAILRLSVPYTGLILSTRETPQMRDELINLGISQISAESSTSPGGYSKEDVNAQFNVSDHRTLDEIVRTSIEHGLLPSFCAACYRKERTGEAFMHLAKPGTIKNKCSMNALITLKEYLDDFASAEVKTKGYALIEKEKNNLSAEDREYLEKVYQRINSGRRDEYV